MPSNERNEFTVEQGKTMWTIDLLFDVLTERKASDICFAPGAPPMMWVAGRMQPFAAPSLAPADIEAAFYPLLTASQRERLAATGDVDFSVGRAGLGRLRLNVHRQRGMLAAAIRYIPADVPTFDRLKLPARVRQFADLPRGLVLVTGGAGSGKSTTLAAMVEYMNQTHAYHIITLEDPIEFMFEHRRSVIEQREVGVDCGSFSSALRAVVRQRPDVILVGEMRDLETISAALTAAETGHLVLASLHTVNAVETVNRIVDVFPGSQQPQVRVQVADTLQGVACQTLFHDELDGTLVPAVEIMVSTPAIRRAIRDNETHLVHGMIEMGRAQGMQTLDAAIAQLVRGGHITMDVALAKCQNQEKVLKTA